VGQLRLHAEGGRPWSLHAMVSRLPSCSSEGGKWADSFPSEGYGSKSPWIAGPCPYVAGWQEGGPTATRQIGDASRPLQSVATLYGDSRRCGRRIDGLACSGLDDRGEGLDGAGRTLTALT
jgi:hypothetical protein